MLHRQGIEVRLRNGIEGELIPEFDNEPGRNKVAIEAVGGLLLCPEIVIYPEFNWFDADGLYIAVEYGTPTAQIILWAPKPQELDHASEPASFFIPGAKFWDDAKAKAVCFEYCLTNRPAFDCGEEQQQDCPHVRPGVVECIGTVAVSVKRRKISSQALPRAFEKEHLRSPTLSENPCKHFLARFPKQNFGLSICGVEQKQSLDFGRMTVDPLPESLEDIKGRRGNWMNSVFIYRSSNEVHQLLRNFPIRHSISKEFSNSPMREAEEDSQVAMDEPEFSRPSRETRSKQRGELKRNSTHHVHNANIEKMQKRPRHNRYLHGQGERVSGSTEEPHEQLSSNEQTLPFLRGSTPDPDFRPRSGTVSPPQIERCPINKELEDSIRPESTTSKCLRPSSQKSNTMGQKSAISHPACTGGDNSSGNDRPAERSNEPTPSIKELELECHRLEQELERRRQEKRRDGLLNKIAGLRRELDELSVPLNN